MYVTNAIREIGGRDYVFAFNEALRVWGDPFKGRLYYPPVRYWARTLNNARDENRNNYANWRLCFCWGLSLHQMSVRRKKQPTFESLGWQRWGQRSQMSWYHRIQDPGYYLIDFDLRWTGKVWADQQALVRYAGLLPVPEEIVTEALFGLYDEKQFTPLIGGSLHWGTSVIGVSAPAVGWGPRGLNVDNFGTKYHSSMLGTCAMEKWDF